MSSSAINSQIAQLKIGNIQNQVDTSFVYNSGVWSFKNSTALTSVTITDAGRVGIGTSTPDSESKLHVSGGNVVATGGNFCAGVTRGYFWSGDNSFNGGIYGSDSGNKATLQSPQTIAFRTASNDRMSIDASGNVGIGTGSPSYNLDIGSSSSTSNFTQRTISGSSYAAMARYDLSGTGTLTIGFNNSGGVVNNAPTGVASLWMQQAYPLVFGTAGTERMRIDASGNLLAGGKTSSNILNVGAQLNANGTVWGTVSAAADCIASYTKTSLTSGILFSGYSDVGGTTATKLLIYSDGNVRIAAGSTYGNFSDIKFKENIVDATPKLEDVLKLQVRNFTIKNEGLKAIGFIAQEFEQVFPALVVTSPDKDMEGNELGTESKAIKESALIPILVKALQELSAKNEALEARLATLESKP